MNSRGQTFLPDYLASILVFGIILTIFLSSWNSVLSDQTEFEDAKQIRRTARQTTTFLVSTPGYPSNWEKDSVEVQIPGFAEPSHVLQGEKLDAFDNIRYEEQKELLQASDFRLEIRETKGESLGDQPVAVIVEQGSSLSEVETVDVLNGSDIVWDLYWPSSSDRDRLGALTARNIYNYTYQGDEMFQDMVGNASDGSYGTVISEDANIGLSEIDNEDRLKNFVEGGGTYFQSGDKGTFIRDLFGLNEVSIGGSGQGEVLEASPLLNKTLSRGEDVEFSEEVMAFENPDTEFVNDTGSPYGCLACGWREGRGKVYFIQDFESESESLIAFDGGYAFGLIEGYGRHQSQAETVVPVKRTVRVNLSGNLKTAEMKYIVWR